METDVAWEALYDARDRIDDSLNLRFERDTDMYIPLHKIEALKKDLYEKKFAKINGYFVAKEMPVELLVKIILTNAWLINDITFKTYNEFFKDIFMACDFEHLKNYMTDVIKDKLDMEEKFRIAVLCTYVDRMEASECSKMLKGRDKLLRNDHILSICIRKVIFESRSNSRSKMKLLFEYMQTYPRLINLLDNRAMGTVLSTLFDEGEWKDVFENYLFNELLRAESIGSVCGYWIGYCWKVIPESYFNTVFMYISKNQYSLNERGATKKILNDFKMKRYFTPRFQHHENYISLFIYYFYNMTSDQVRFDMISFVGGIYDRNIVNLFYPKMEEAVGKSYNRRLSAHLSNIMNNEKRPEIETTADIYDVLAETTGKLADPFIAMLAYTYHKTHTEFDRLINLYHMSANRRNGSKLIVEIVKKFKFTYLDEALRIYEDELDDDEYNELLFNAVDKTNLHRTTKGELKSRLYNFMAKHDFSRYQELTTRV